MIEVSLDNTKYNYKPDGSIAKKLTATIGDMAEQIEVKELAFRVGWEGQSFCPAVFNGSRRNASNFKKMQLFVLDFDSGILFEDVLRRADEYDIPILFAYHTFSSSEEIERFRVLFLHEIEVESREAAEIIIKLLIKIFPECDSQCKDVCRLFWGGKELIYYSNDEKPFNIADLAQSYQRFEWDKNRKNCNRNIDTFAKANHIGVKNHRLLIFRACTIGEIEEKIPETDIIYIGHGKISSFCVIKQHHPDMHKKRVENKTRIRLSDGEQIETVCRLYKDFKTGNILDHNERFLLLTNLRFIESGRKLFFRYLPLHTERIEQWKYDADYIVKMDYAPASCEGGCPYKDICVHKKNLLLTLRDYQKIRKCGEEPQYYPIKEAFRMVKYNILDAVSQMRKGIYLIPAQTAIGKTTAYCDIVSSDLERKYIIAVPTNILKKQVKDKLSYMGDCYMTPSIDELGLPADMVEYIRQGYAMGKKYAAHTVIREFMKEHGNSNDPCMQTAIAGCERYLEMKNKLEAHPRIIITTHARLFHMTKEFLSNYTVIVDEDILMSVFQSMQMVYMEEVKEAIESHIFSGFMEDRMKQIAASKEETYGAFTGMTAEYDDTLEISDTAGNLLDIGVASTYFVSEDGREVQYFVPKMLPGGKYIILSATLKSELYHMYFHGWYIKEYPKMECRYKGRLIQYTARSLSRRDCEIYFKEVMEKAKEISGTDQILTFKRYLKEGESEGILLNEAGLYFGNSSGINKLTGKDLIIIGTPHNIETVYKLIGKHMGIDIDDSLHRMRITYNGYSFNFTTYTNLALREIQLYFICSELEQAIGRARLLRESCTVYLFSNFPCEQAELIQEDYLEAFNAAPEDL